ncbi:MAG: family 43 glycosylhydrolase [Lachnospiraceae bacterium]|nr:family 43 glycosylhydrolase [Lachnospiraceae bacterium]
MKKRVGKKILSAVLAASMILGNIALPQGLGEVHAAQVDIGSIISGKTQVTDSEIENLYRKMSYTPQGVHDPSIIKIGDEWYVFGSHRAVAKTSDLQNWQTVNIDGLFGDGEGKVLTPDEAFVNSLYQGTIQTSDAAKALMRNKEEEETEETDQVTVESEETSESETESETVSESETEFESETEQPSESEPASKTEQETEQLPESEPASANGFEADPASEAENKAEDETVAESEKYLYGEVSAAPEETSERISETETEPESKTETEPESKTETEPESKTETEPESETEAELEETTEEDSVLFETETESESSKNKKTAVSKQAEKELADGEVTFGSFDAKAWCTASDGWNILDGTNSNIWAPDIIYNPTMKKYCMYLSLNGEYQNSVVILLTANQIEGPYAYQGPVVYSGFTAEKNVPTSYQNTDMKYIFGESELLERYQKISGITLDADGKIANIDKNEWANYWPHAIDPAVLYDDDGKLWMIYGSWSGGIYALELDETTGLRDYSVTYESDFDSKGQSVTSDPYFGKKIAGGYYVSGEGPYVEKIGNYYYLFMSYGFYAPNGGYSMRIFRSENPDGPYVDTKGTSAIYDKFSPNFIADYAKDVNQIDTRGMRLMTYYQWDHMSKGEVAQGHNSAIQDGDRAYVIYHTKFNDNSAAHELRVHELFQNKNGWILASPFAFANDNKLNYNAEPTDPAGEYEIIVGDYSRGYDENSGQGKLNGNYTGPLSEIVTYTLASDGIITKDGQEAGTWVVESGKAYATLTIDGHNYSGVFAEVTKDSAGIKTMCFTGVDEQTGITLWGAKKLGGKAVIADNVANPSYAVPKKVYGSFELPATGSEGVDLYWKSSNENLAADDGTISEMPEQDTDVTFTMTMVSGDYYYQKDYTITVASKNSLADGKYLVGEAYTDNALTLPDASRPSMDNPFYITNTAGLELSGGVSIEFDVKHNGAVNALGALFAFNGSESGKLYFTQGSYLGYNALGGYYDANLNNYALVKDYIGDAIAESGKETAHVVINLSAAGFEVLVDGKQAYDQTILDTDNGAGDLEDYTNVLTWLQSSASSLCMGYGSWWDDVPANAVISNMKFYINESNDQSAVDSVIASLKKQIPASTTADISLPVKGAFGTTISWTTSNPDIIAADGKVTIPGKETEVTLTATVTKGEVTATETFKVIVKLPATSNVSLERELLEITEAAQIELIDNPFYGKNLDTLVVNYDITFKEGGFKTGYDGIFAFYNSETTGRVSFQTNPYICLNEMLPEGQANVYLDINHPDKNNLAKDMVFGQEYSVKIVIKKTECSIYLDGKLAVNVDAATMSGNADFAELLDYVGKCDKFSWGVGDRQASFWGSELSTVKNIRISSNEYQSFDQEEVVLDAAPVVMDNPLYGKNLKEVVLDFNVNFAEDAAMDGWNGLLAFFQPSEGAAAGRVSIQTAPYICYNKMENEIWTDINNPNDLNAAQIEIPVMKLDRSQTHHYYIRISAFEVVMEIDGKQVELVKNGAASYQDILDFISICQKFSWGVNNDTSFWAMEKATLKNASVKGYYSEKEENNKVTVTLHYPDGTIETKILESNTILKEPEFEAEDANGKYGITWYADEAKTVIFRFGEAVSEDITLYGRYCYYYEEPGEDENGNNAPVRTGIWVERIDDQQYTGAAIKPVITVYDGTKKLTEKVDYKVSYSDNKKVSTEAKPAKVTITPCGNYEKASKFFIYFNINQRQLTKENVTIKYKPEINVKYNNQKAAVGQTQKISLKYGKLTIPAKEYTVTYKKGEETVQQLTDIGTYQVVMKMKDTSSYAGELSYDIIVTDKILTSDLKVKVPAQNYSGEPLTPNVSVTYKGKNIVPAGQQLSDIFDIDYKDNINAGLATLTLTAKADSEYCGSQTVNFKINGTSISKAAVEGFLSSISYTGEAVTQNVRLIVNRGKADEKTLEEGKDYDIAYANNTNAGKASMTITGKGAFSGTVKKTFTIGKINLQQAGGEVTIAFVDTAQPLKIAQDKSGAKPAVTVTYKGTALEQDKDYTITYSGNNAVASNAKVTVKGIGN